MHSRGNKIIKKLKDEINSQKLFNETTETIRKQLNETIENNKALAEAKEKLEKEIYQNAMAEAIIENSTSKGFWLDKNYLKESTFNDIL